MPYKPFYDHIPVEDFDNHEDLFVYVDFMQPIKQNYAVVFGAEKPAEQREYYFHKNIPTVRSEELKICNSFRCKVLVSKSYSRREVKRVFRKEKSVFKDWKEDV